MQDKFNLIWRRFGRVGQSSCERLEKTISLHADGVANARETRQVEEHIAACEACKTHLAAIRAMSGLLSQQPEPAAPQGLSDRLRLAIQAERRIEQSGIAERAKTSRRVLTPRWALAGALATVALVGAVVVGTHFFSSGNLPVAGETPARVALAPAPNQPANPTASKLAPATPPQKVATALPGARAPHSAPLEPILRHTAPGSISVEHMLPRVAEANVPTRTVPAGLRPTPKRSLPEHPMIVARIPAISPSKSPTPGEAFVAPRPKAPSAPQSQQIAALPPQAPASHNSTVPPPAVNNPNTGEKPVQVAQLPASVPAQPSATSPEIRLASRLKDLGNAAQVAQVAINEERPVDYTGSLSIVGSSIR